MNADQELLSAFDGHRVEAVQAALAKGANPCEPIRGKLPVDWLLEQYERSDRLADCLRLLFSRGAVLRDTVVTPVLLNDAAAIKAAVMATPSILQHRTRMVSAFTSLEGVSLLHVAAEYGNLNAARALIEAGADVNARAEIDEHGFNGHTPLFHTVNSMHNRSEPIMRLLLAAGAKTDIQLAGMHWGKRYEWETTFFDVTPISFAQMGLLPQVHRNEREIYSNLACLLEASGRPAPPLGNVPNRYLRPKSRG
jgi:ankyrin repeat protein